MMRRLFAVAALLGVVPAAARGGAGRLSRAGRSRADPRERSTRWTARGAGPRRSPSRAAGSSSSGPRTTRRRGSVRRRRSSTSRAGCCCRRSTTPTCIRSRAAWRPSSATCTASRRRARCSRRCGRTRPRIRRPQWIRGGGWDLHALSGRQSLEGAPRRRRVRPSGPARRERRPLRVGELEGARDRGNHEGDAGPAARPHRARRLGRADGDAARGRRRAWSRSSCRDGRAKEHVDGLAQGPPDRERLRPDVAARRRAPRRRTSTPTRALDATRAR